MGNLERSVSASPLDSRQGGLQGARVSDPYHYWLAGDLAHFSPIAKVMFVLFMALVAAGMFIVGTWALDDVFPFQLISASVVPDSTFPGSRVMTYYKVNVLRGFEECTIDIERSWRDAHGNEWPSTTAHLKYSKGANDIGLTMAVPTDAWEGASDIENSIVYSCNPLQKLFPRHEPMTPLTVIVQR